MRANKTKQTRFNNIPKAEAANVVNVETFRLSYRDGILQRAQTLAESLKGQLEAIVNLGLSLDEAVRDGSIQSNDLVCLPVFGGGLTWGSALIKW